MNLFWVILSIAALTVLLILLISYICFRMVFFVPRKLVTVPKAGHGLVYVADNDLYFNSVVEFSSENDVPTKIHQKPM